MTPSTTRPSSSSWSSKRASGSSTTTARTSLIEAVAADLASQAGFLVIDDSQLRVAVNVSADEDGTFVAEVDADRAGREQAASDFRTLLVDVEPDDAAWGVPDGTRVKDDRLSDD